MKILFVYPNITYQRSPQVGVSYLLPLLSKHQVMLFDVSACDFTEYKTGEKFVECFKQFKPDLVLISCRSNEWGYVKKLLTYAYPTPTLVGGIHATINTEEVLSHATMAMRGESEEALKEFIEKFENGQDYTKVQNLWVKHRGKITKNEVRNLIPDLDTLPIPLWQAFNKIHYRESYVKDLFKEINCVGTFETSRGCPYSCTYCCSEYLHGLYKGKGTYHRRKSPKRVVEEVRLFKEIYPDCNFVYFIDDTFMVNEKWLEEFAGIYDKTPFVFMTRPEMVNEHKMKLIAEMGGKGVSIGIENGNENFRRTVLNRTMSNEQIIQAFRTAKDFGLHTYSFNMVGLPYETRDDIQSTIDLNKQIQPDIAQFTTFFPFKGTKLFDICEKERYLKGEYPESFNYYQKSCLKLPNFEEGEIEEWTKKAEALFQK